MPLFSSRGAIGLPTKPSDFSATSCALDDRGSCIRRAGFLLLCCFLYWLCWARPLAAEPWEWADDGLYLLQGGRIARWLTTLNGSWLGAYEPRLLAKPPCFGFWLALVQLSGLPLRIAEFSSVLVLPFLLRRAVRPIVFLAGWRFAVVTFLLVVAPGPACQFRLLRDTLQVTLAAGVLIAAVGLVLRAPGSVRTQARWAVLLGLLFAAAYLNREESVWLAPAAAVAITTATAVGWRTGKRWLIVVPAVACISAASLPVVAVCTLNARDYGIFVTSIRRGPGLTHLYHTLTRLEPDRHERFLPVAAETRAHAYRCSPEFARLQPYLEGPVGDGFARNAAHIAISGRPPGTREFFACNLEWSLLIAADAAGASDAGQTDRLFGKAAVELDAAIRDGRLKAGTGSLGFMAAPMPGDARRLAEAAGRSMMLLLTVQGMNPDPAPHSSGIPAELERMSARTHAALAPSANIAAPEMESPIAPVRRRAWTVSVDLLRVAYPAALQVTFLLVLLTVARHRHSLEWWLVSGCGLILLASQIGLCLLLGCVEVFAYPILNAPQSYNSLGYAPLAVLAAFAFIAADFAVSRRAI